MSNTTGKSLNERKIIRTVSDTVPMFAFIQSMWGNYHSENQREPSGQIEKVLVEKGWHGWSYEPRLLNRCEFMVIRKVKYTSLLWQNVNVLKTKSQAGPGTAPAIYIPLAHNNSSSPRSARNNKKKQQALWRICKLSHHLKQRVEHFLYLVCMT